MKKLTVEKTKEMLLFTADELIKAKDELTKIDSKIGDGDHGIGMENGFSSIREAISGKEYDTINQLYQDAGMAMLNSMGGASGVIFASLFLGGIKKKEAMTELTAKSFILLWRDGLEAIKARGGAKVGDKTMVDALEPAVEAMEAAGEQTEDLTILMQKASEAAKEGVEKTKQYIAKYGRAKSLMERAIGYQDAGATSTYFILKSMYEFLKMQEEEKEKKEIIIGCDNAAVDLKNPIIKYLEKLGYQVKDVGCKDSDDPTTCSKIAERVCQEIIADHYQKRGILLCGTGIGMAITANKFKGIRAAVCHDGFSTERSVLSNDCNVLCMGERVIGLELAKKNLKEWLELHFVPGPSSAKINDIAMIERMNMK